MPYINSLKKPCWCQSHDAISHIWHYVKIDCIELKLLTYLLIPWSRDLLEKLTGFAAIQEIPRILWNPKVHYVLTSARHLSLS